MDAALASILVVDDDPQVLDSFRRATRGLTARMRYALNAEEGWQLVEAEVPQLIVCDYRLPGADGLSFLDRVHRRFPEVKAILHTAEVLPQPLYGMDLPVLGKPCSTDALRLLLSELTSPPPSGPA